MRPRLKDVAAKAGVAPNTASTILNRKSNSWASEATRERVFKAAKELGYRPNRAAIGIRMGSFKAIGLVIPDLHNPYYTTFCDQLERVLRANGYDLILEHSREDMDYQLKCLDSLLERQVDGVAYFVNTLEKHLEFLAKAKQMGKRVVALTGPPPAGGAPLPFDSVQIDFAPGLVEAVDYLVSKGHQRYAFLCALSAGQSADERPDIYTQLLQERGIPTENATFITCSHELEDAYQSFRDFLENQAAKSRPTALIALNDLAAIGAMRAAADCGVLVPDDLSVVGVDDIPLGRYLSKRLSTIRQPVEAMAKATAMMLLNRLETPKSAVNNLSVQTQRFASQLVIRETTDVAKA